MTNLIRRDAICTLAGGVASLFCGPTLALTADKTSSGAKNVAIATGTLRPSDPKSRVLSGFLETGVRGGQSICSLVEQDVSNPMVMSVFAVPREMGSRHGVEVTVHFFAEPTGHITLNVLHIGTNPAESNTIQGASV